MPLRPGDRIVLIREIAALLDHQGWADIDLVLGQHEIAVSHDKGPTKYEYVVHHISALPDETIADLHQFVTADASSTTSATGPWSGTKLRLFCSHLAAHQAEVARTAEVLTRFGIDTFVAHDSIEPSEEWAAVIEAALTDCDAMIVFLHSGISESRWCDQEVGWALGRRRPVLPLKFDVDPYGFLGKYQAQVCASISPEQVASLVMDWLVKTPSLHAALTPGLVDAFARSPSWSFTRSIVPYLERLASVSDDDLNRMEEAAKGNIDVRECIIGGRSGPGWVQHYVAERRGTPS